MLTGNLRRPLKSIFEVCATVMLLPAAYPACMYVVDEQASQSGADVHSITVDGKDDFNRIVDLDLNGSRFGKTLAQSGSVLKNLCI